MIVKSHIIHRDVREGAGITEIPVNVGVVNEGKPFLIYHISLDVLDKNVAEPMTAVITAKVDKLILRVNIKLMPTRALYDEITVARDSHTAYVGIDDFSVIKTCVRIKACKS